MTLLAAAESVLHLLRGAKHEYAERLPRGRACDFCEKRWNDNNDHAQLREPCPAHEKDLVVKAAKALREAADGTNLSQITFCGRILDDDADAYLKQSLRCVAEAVNEYEPLFKCLGRLAECSHYLARYDELKGWDLEKEMSDADR